jgi:V/A-type H+-transporting ATPase subunit E
MSNNIANLDGVVSKLKEQGIQAGKEEKQRIIEEAKAEAKKLVEDAELQRKQIIDEAENKAALTEKNSNAAIAQAMRDMLEATKVAILNYVKSVFGEQSKSLFTQKEYLENLLKVVVENISGNKTVSLATDMVKDMEAFLMKQALAEKIELKPLSGNDAKIVVDSTDNEGLQFVLTAKDVEDSLFSLLNKDLVKRITENKEE